MWRRAFVLGALACTVAAPASAQIGLAGAKREVERNKREFCRKDPEHCPNPLTWFRWLPEWAKTGLGVAGGGGVLWGFWKLGGG